LFLFVWLVSLTSFVLFSRLLESLETSFMYHLTSHHMMDVRDRVERFTGPSPCRPLYDCMYVCLYTCV
jgi:hypothetical protein